MLPNGSFLLDRNSTLFVHFQMIQNVILKLKTLKGQATEEQKVKLKAEKFAKSGIRSFRTIQKISLVLS